MKRVVATAVFLTALPLAWADFILPEHPVGAQTDFAWWDAFTDPYTDFQLPAPDEMVDSFPEGEGNIPNNPFSTNFDARLIQNGPNAGTFISSSGGIYGNSGVPTQFQVFDRPAFEIGSVLLQTRAIGRQPDLKSAFLYYRETEDGVLKEAGAPSGSGFLQRTGNFFTMWEWDLSEKTIFDFFIVFAASESSMSLLEVQMDTFDQKTNHLGVALEIGTTSLFVTVGEVEHNLIGESGPRATYRPGDQVELHAVTDPFYGHEFVGWVGDLSGDANPAILTITESPTVKAVFAPRTYQVWTYNQINPYITNPSYSARADIDADPDGDGFNNLLEYALGGLPEELDAADIQPRMEISETGEPNFTYRRQMAATDLIYRVLVSEDLVNWHYNGDGSDVVYTEELPEPAFNGDGTETVTIRSTEALSTGRQFFQLKAIHQPES